MKTWLFVLSVLVALAYLKWILLLLIYPVFNKIEDN